MKHLTIIISSILLMNAYTFAAEYPRQGKLSRQKAFRKENKSPSIMLHNKSEYDISTESLVIIPGESKKISLQKNLELEMFFLELFLSASDDKLTLKFKDPLPQNVSFTTKLDLVELTYDEDCIKSYIINRK